MLTVHPDRSGEQLAVRDVRDTDGRGQVTATGFVYRDDGVYLSLVRASSELGGGLRDTREWRLEPPELLVAADAEPGYVNTFTMRNADTTAAVTVELLRHETVPIAGQPVATVVTRIHIELSGAVQGTQTTTAWTRPADLLTVKEHVESEVTNGALQLRSAYRAVIQHLEPRP